MEIVFDIESTGLLNEHAIEYSTYPFRLKKSFGIHCIVAKDINTDDVYKFTPENLNEFPEFFKGVTKVIGHNIIDFDLLAIQLYFGIPFRLNPSLIDGKPVEIVDTLVMSKLLNPDRFGGHGLEAWGERLSFLKGDFGKQNDWSQFSQEMLDYCEQDVHLNHKLYNYMLKYEWGTWPWHDAFELEQQVRFYITLQSHLGFHFDKKYAEWCVQDLDARMKDLADRVEPLLPTRKMTKTNAKKYTPPKIQVKKDGELSSHMKAFVEKVGMDIERDEYGDFILKGFGKEWTLPMKIQPVLDEEPMRMADQDSIKQYLISKGWEPTAWNEKDLTTNTKKQKLSWEKYREAVERYVESTVNSEYMDHRLEFLKTNVANFKKRLLTHDLSKPLRVRSTPSFTVGQDKQVCPDLDRLGEQYDWVAYVVEWLTYRHRRNAVLSDKGSGWLNNERVGMDGRISTPADTAGTNTFRYTHKDVANIPRVTSKYGEHIRSLFGVTPGNYQIGFDAAGLEARVEAHYTKQFEGGDDYAVALISEKPNDIHTVNSVKMGVDRDTAKTLKYATTYGAQVAKIAKTLGCSKEEAETIFNDFWEASKPLKILKEKVANYWKKNGRKVFIRGIDGRKLMTRSEHSLLNVLFQSAGAIVMKKAMIKHFTELEEKGVYKNPFEHSDLEAFQMIHYHDEAQWEVKPDLVKFWTFDSKEEAQEFDYEGKTLSNIHENEDGTFTVGYCIVGDLAHKTLKEAGEDLGFRVSLAADYDIGFNWSETH